MGVLKSISERYPIGTKLRLADDYPGVVREVVGYELFADYVNLLFHDGGRLNFQRLGLIEEVVA